MVYGIGRKREEEEKGGKERYLNTMSPHTDMTFVFHGGRSADARVSLSCMPHYPVLPLPLHDPLHALALLQSLRLLCSTKMSTSTREGGREGEGEGEGGERGREREQATGKPTSKQAKCRKSG